MKRLAIITTHPIQYYAPVFQLLHQRNKLRLKVFYTWGEGSLNKYDPGFGRAITWDIPLLEGYPFEWVQNISPAPGSDHFNGITNPGLNRQICDFNPHAILVFGWSYRSHLKVLRYFHGKLPVYFRGDSTLLNQTNGIRELLRFSFLRWVYHFVDHAFYVGTNNKLYYKKCGLKDAQLTFAPHAIDNDRFSSIHYLEVEQLKHNLGIQAQDIVVLFAGKLEDVKSPLLLLESFLTLQTCDTHLIFVGNGELEIKLKLGAGDAKNIHFLDFQNQSFMPVIYQACDLFCLPSKSESWGLAVNEAMACGKAILASDKVGCAIDLVKKDFNGLIFKNGDHGDLVTSLKILTKSKERLIEYGKNSLSLIKNWNFTRIAEAIENKLKNEAR